MKSPSYLIVPAALSAAVCWRVCGGGRPSGTWWWPVYCSAVTSARSGHMDTGDANTGHSVHCVNLGGKLAATRTQTWYCTSYQVDI